MRIRILLFGGCCLFSTSLLAQNPTKQVVQGSYYQYDIGKGEQHTYMVDLPAKTFCFIVVNQEGIDLKVETYDPQGEKIEEIDSPNGLHGIEPVMISAEDAGTYEFVVEPLNEDPDPGAYSLYIEKQEPLGKTPTQKVDQLFAPWDRKGVPGASIAIVQNGKITYSKGYGYANLEYDIPNGPETVFHIASVSKQFTAFAIAYLAHEGKIDLDADIRSYLPEMPEFKEPITVRHLVHHTSGLRDQWNLLSMAGWRFDDVITQDQIMRLIVRQKELNFKPGDEFLYCNTGFTLMAEIVERVSEMSFAEWTQQHIFQPLEMDKTLFYDDHEQIVPNRAYSYGESQGTYVKRVLSYANVGATSLFTTVEDLSKWAVNFETRKVGNEAIMDQMHEQGTLNSGDTIAYAFGQFISTYKGIPQVQHGGADAGYRTYLVRFPEHRTSVIVFSNLGSFNPGGLAYKIADIYLADQIQEDTGDSATELEPEIEAGVALPTQLLEAYLGRYELAPGFVLGIRLEEGKLMGQATGQSAFPLQAESDTAFVFSGAGIKIVFHRKADTQAHELILYQGGQVIPAPRLEDFDATSVDLAEFEGTYFSPELETTYWLGIEDDKLTVSHQRHPDFTLEPTKVDEFSAAVWAFGRMAFERNEEKEITGVRVSNGRVRNLWFEKIK